jgi:hypothetical protein
VDAAGRPLGDQRPVFLVGDVYAALLVENFAPSDPVARLVLARGVLTGEGSGRGLAGWRRRPGRAPTRAVSAIRGAPRRASIRPCGPQ